MSTILQLKDVNKGFGEGLKRNEVLADISLDVEEGEFIAILGFSGAGKTTLMSMLAGLEKPDNGEIRFRGEKVEGPSPKRGIVFQNYALMPWLSVQANVCLAVDAVHQQKRRKNARNSLSAMW
nr:ATP-binding cassette domain-containing protein [Marinicella sp. W31]MDC2880292.1 ATP-binding cassette domain-containing protein [Marinicella sp. W31]